MRSLSASFSRALVAFRALVLAGFIGLFPFSSWGQESSDFVPLTIEDLDPSARSAVFTLASSISGNDASSATVDQNVQAILDLLTSVYHGSGTTHFIRSLPFASRFNSIGEMLASLFVEGSWSGADALPSSTRSYLYQIQRALYGQSGIPASSGALLPMVASLLATSSSNRVDMSWTNALPALVSASTNLNAFFDGAMVAVESFVDLFGYDMAHFFHEDPAYVLNEIDSLLNSALGDYLYYWDHAYDPDDESWRVQLTYDGGLGDRIGELAGSISDGNQATVDALDGIRDLLRMISTNVAATHDDIYGASQEEDNISEVANDGADDYDYAVDSASSDIEDTLDLNEPDFEVHYTDNPLAPLANAVDFTQTMRSKMPDMSQVQTSSRVYLFKTEWDREHLLTRPGGQSRLGSGLGQGLSEISFDLSGSDPHVPNELLSYAATAMAWAWNLAAAVTAFYLFRQFWDWVASWRV